MNPFSTLSEDNHEQIRKYLRFFRNKKEGALRAVEREINEIRSERLNEDVYTRDDMTDFADYLSSAVRVIFCYSCDICFQLTPFQMFRLKYLVI